MKTLLLHITLLLSCGLAMAQGTLDSIQRIDTVSINADACQCTRTEEIETEIQKYASNYQSIDSTDKIAYQGSTLGEVLQENTGVYIKSYGSGALATTGFRGMGASQTKTFWNGVPINSGMNGTIDLSNLPAALFENIDVSLGGSSLFSASGSFGGAISLGSNKPIALPQTVVSSWYEVGSFGEHNSAIKLETGNEKIQMRSGFLYRRAKNDFPFKNTTLFGEPTQHQVNADFGQLAAVIELYFKPIEPIVKHSQFWWKNFASKTNRNIPPTMLSADAFQSQYDWLAMSQLFWAGVKQNHIITSSATYKFDEIYYTSELPTIDSRSQTHGLFMYFTDNWFLVKGFKITTRVDHTSQWAFSNNFNGTKYQPVSSILFNPEYRYKANRLIINLLMRQELVYSQLSPFLPSLSIRYIPFLKSGLYLYTNIFRNYRYPTLNDRYWSVGGNPNLQQEKGWGTEGKVGYDKSFKQNIKLETSINAYYLDVQNWILWLPESSTGIWTPENVKRVKSRGVEALVKLDGKKNHWTYRFTANYHFNKATNETSGGAIGSSTDKILIYTPQHLGNASGMVGFKGYYLQYRQHICGKRYITSDNSQQLPAFTTGDLRIGKDFGKKLKGLSLYLAAENLWNAEYQNIAWRPMPGRNFSGGVRYEFNIENSKLKN